MDWFGQRQTGYIALLAARVDLSEGRRDHHKRSTSVRSLRRPLLIGRCKN